MDEAQYLADRVAVIAAGRFVAEGTPATLAGRNTARPRLVLPAGPGAAIVTELGWSSDDQGGAVLEPSDLGEALYSLSSWARANGVSLEELEIHRPSLEDVYLELTGGGVADRPAPAEAAGRRRGHRR
jgi:ABC-2 type transport system ATP-binding protein